MTDASDFFNQSIVAAKTNPALAYKLLMSATQASPTMSQAWFNLACMQADARMLNASIASWHRALAGDIAADMIAKCLTNIGHRLYQLGRLNEAIEWTEKAIEANPKNAYPWENLAAIHIQLGNTQKAVEYAKLGYELSDEPVTQVSYALALLNNGKLADGLKQFEGRFAYKMQDILNFPYPRWNGKHTKRLFIVGEQGLGDTLSFCRFIPWAARRADVVYLSVQAELRSLVGLAVPSNVIMVDPMAAGTFPEADCFCPIMSLPTAMMWNDEQIKACEDLDYGRGRRVVHNKTFMVGISWAGSPSNDRDHWRSIPINLMIDLTSMPGIDWVSLQAGPQSDDLKRFGGDALARDASHLMKDAADTALFITSAIDLVITVDSFLGHLCGSLNVPCWVLTARNAGDWRLGRNGDAAPMWYPNHRIFRQGEDASWQPVIKQVAEKLKERVGASASF